MKFVGRYRELEQLRRHRSSSQLTAIYGRRRIGKSSLIDEAFKEERTFRFEGLEGESEARQKEHFISELESHFGLSGLSAASTWKDLLKSLSALIREERVVVVFDEFQWLAAEKDSLVSELKYVWDNFFLKNNNVHLVLCGSISSFIVKKVIESKALYGRIDLVIHLQGFDFQEMSENFLKNRSFLEQLDYYLAVGGVPKYLQLYDTSHSPIINFERLAFQKTGYLFQEEKRLFISHFGRNPDYRSITQFLSQRPGVNRRDIQKELLIKGGGTLSHQLEELELADFIESYAPLHNLDGSKLIRYRIKDYFLRFHYHFIAKSRRQIEERPEVSFRDLISLQQLAIWKGLSFERFCFDHSYFIARALGFSGIKYTTGSWYKRKDQNSGFQIDLAFKRADRVLTVCEIKYQENLTSKVISECQQKLERLRHETKYSIEPVLITAYEPPKVVREAGFFQKVLCVEEIFG